MSTVPGLAVQSAGDRVDQVVMEVRRLLEQLGTGEDFPGRRGVIWYLEGAVVALQNGQRGLRDAELLLTTRSAGR